MILRKATTHDRDFLLRLKNDPVMRKFSVVTHDKIKLKAHLAWLKKHLNEIQIAMDKGKRIGMFRIYNKEVSINIDPKYRGKGYGDKILKAGLIPGLWAKIVDGNVASMRLFLTNGFMVTDYKRGYYVLKN
jgi:RimJ/RimL family protein N-acetyltransferase